MSETHEDPQAPAPTLSRRRTPAPWSLALRTAAPCLLAIPLSIAPSGLGAVGLGVSLVSVACFVLGATLIRTGRVVVRADGRTAWGRNAPPEE